MGRGLQVFDAAGNLMFNSSDYLLRVAGKVNTGQATGFVAVPAFALGGGFALAFPDASVGSDWVQIRTYTDTSGFGWDWPADGGDVSSRRPGYIIYGVRL